MEDIRGLRVPYLRPGWNRQFLMMKEFGFVYDSSIPAPLSDPPVWPYTLDFKIPHKCIGRRKCPSRSFPGIWVWNFFTFLPCRTLTGIADCAGDNFIKKVFFVNFFYRKYLSTNWYSKNIIVLLWTVAHPISHKTNWKKYS